MERGAKGRRRWPVRLLAALAGIAAGTLSAFWLGGLLPGPERHRTSAVVVDGWSANFDIGTNAADPYTKAMVARHGLLALARSEAVYFTRVTDSAGRALSERCRYRLSGGAMPARWWSVTLYDAASRLPMNDDDALSVDMSVIESARVGNRKSDESWQAIIGPDRPADDSLWISSRNAGQFDLTLRLYVPEPELIEQPAAVLVPPQVERLSCRGPAQ